MTLTNAEDQNLLHLAAKYGSAHCLTFLLNFKNIDPNKLDAFNKIPLNYLIENFPLETEINKDMFLKLASTTDYVIVSGNEIQSNLNIWQRFLYDNVIEKKKISIICA